MNCPICSSDTIRIEGEYRYYVEPFDRIVSLRYNHCQSCDFAFCANPPSPDELADYYSRSLRLPIFREADKQHVRQQAEFLLRHLSSPNPRVLEIGANQGLFLDTLKETLNADTYFNEHNIEAVKVLKKKGHNVDTNDRIYDAIVFCHVLEHIPRPLEFVYNLSKRLVDGGVIFFEVPDLSYRTLEMVDILAFDHVGYFSAQTVFRLAARTNCMVAGLESSRVEGSATSENQIMRALLKPLPVEPAPSLAEYLGRSIRLAAIVERTMRQRAGKVAFYGAGSMTFSLLPNLAIKPAAIFDMSPSKIGRKFMDVSVYDANTINPNDVDAVILTVLAPEKPILDFLLAKGFAEQDIIRLSDLIKEL